LASKQDLNASAEEIARSRIARAQRLRLKSFAAAVETCRKYARVVEDDEIAGAKEIGEFPEVAVLELSIRGVQVQKSGRSTVWKRLLRDQIPGQFVAEIRDQHAR
jgi:hypothetical protein